MTSMDLQEIADRIAIGELNAIYNRAFDDGDVAGAVATFTEDGVFDRGVGRTRSGHAELTELVGRVPYGTVHVTADSVIEVDGDAATQVVTLILLKRERERTANSFWMSGRYIDVLRRTEDGWRFAHRRAELDLAE